MAISLNMHMAKKKPVRKKHIPQRTCVACREKTDKRRLTRIVRAQNGVQVDLTGKENGRGAYVCDRPDCWNKIVKCKPLDSEINTEVSEDEKANIAAHRPDPEAHPTKNVPPQD